jgi:hypothetical protein
MLFPGEGRRLLQFNKGMMFDCKFGGVPMLILMLIALAVFVLAAGYHVALLVEECVVAPKRAAAGCNEPLETPSFANRLQRATQEITAIFGLGDD